MEDSALIMAVYADERTMARHYDNIRTSVATVLATGMGAGAVQVLAASDPLVKITYAVALLLFGSLMTTIYGINHRLYFQRLKMGKKMLRLAVDRQYTAPEDVMKYDDLNRLRIAAATQADDESDSKKHRSLWWYLVLLVGVALPLVLLVLALIQNGWT